MTTSPEPKRGLIKYLLKTHMVVNTAREEDGDFLLFYCYKRLDFNDSREKSYAILKIFKRMTLKAMV